MNRVVNFDFPTDNPEQAKAFFADIFNWKFTEWLNEGYWLIETGDKQKNGINGSMIKRRHEEHAASIMIQVENINIILKKVEEEGGQIVFPKYTIPKIGYMAYFKDPECNLIGIIHLDSRAK